MRAAVGGETSEAGRLFGAMNVLQTFGYVLKETHMYKLG